MQTTNNYRGLKAKRNGDRFELLLDRTCLHYALQGKAYIQKTPEPMRVIAPISRSKEQYKAIFTKKAQPDYTGTLKDGRSIVFEAKNTDSTNLAFDRLSPAQEKDLAYHDHLGAVALIVISFSLKRFYYKATLEGIQVEYVNPAHTSQTCPKCTERNKAKDRKYRCSCGFEKHRDIVGAMNIRYAPVVDGHS